MLAFLPQSAFAACSTPSGIAGDIIYNGTYNVLQYCNGSYWVNAGSLGASGGSLIAGDFCTSNGTLVNCATPSTGSGSVVLSASPTITGTLAGASSSWSGTVTGNSSVWSGNVAIGTTATSGALNVAGTVTATSFSGSGAALTGIGTSSLAVTGTPSSTTFLAGNGTWTSITGAGGVTGTGTANYLTLWSSSTALGTSAIYQSGSSIAIGTTTASGALNVNGTVTATNFSGSGASLTGIGTSSLSATGTPSAATFLAGNNSWAVPTPTFSGLTSSDFCTASSSSAIGCSVGSTGTGSVVLSASPTFTGTVTGGTFAGTHTGSGSGLTGIGVSALGGITGTPSSSTYLRGDGTWATTSTGTTTGTGTTNYIALWNGATSLSSSAIYQSGSNIGIGTAVPGNTLTVNGTLGLQFGSNYATTGTQSDVAINTAASVRYTGAGVATFNGIVAGTPGQIMTLHNGSTSVLTLANQAAADTTVANQIVTGTGANLTVASNSAVILQYDPTATNSSGATGAWRVIGGSGGAAAGSTGQVQYNSGSNSLAATTNFAYSAANGELVVGTAAATPVGTSGTVASFVYNVIPQASTYTVASASGGITINAATTGQMAYYSGSNALSGTPNLYVSGGNIGIGTTTPTNILSLGGQSAQTLWMERDYTASTPGNNLTVKAGGAVAGGTNLNGGNLVLSGGISTGTGTSNIQFQTYPAGTTGTADGTATTAMTITGAGSVGIGTTSPTSPLQVQANQNASTYISVQNTTSGTAALSAFIAGNGSNNAQFGAANPSYTTFLNITPNSAFMYANGTGGIALAANNASGPITFAAGGNGEQMRIATNGNVGIGTTSPGYLLEAYGPSTYSSQTGQTQVADSASAMRLNIGVGVDSSSNKVTWLQSSETGVSNTRNLALQPFAGNVGIGITSPNALLSLGNAVTTIKLAAYDGGGTSIYGMGVNAGELTFGAGLSSVSGTPQMVLTSGGAVGINSTSPIAKLDVRGNINYYNCNGYGALYNGGSGEVYVSGCQNMNMGIYSDNRIVGSEVDGISDARRKTAIADLTLERVASFLDKVRPVTFHWKNDKSGTNQFGFIAQQVAKAGFGELIHSSPNPDMHKSVDADGFVSSEGYELNMNYIGVIPILTKAVQQLKADNDNLRITQIANDSMINTLRAANDKADQSIEKLRADQAAALQQLRDEFEAYKKVHP